MRTVFAVMLKSDAEKKRPPQKVYLSVDEALAAFCAKYGFEQDKYVVATIYFRVVVPAFITGSLPLLAFKIVYMAPLLLNHYVCSQFSAVGNKQSSAALKDLQLFESVFSEKETVSMTEHVHYLTGLMSRLPSEFFLKSPENKYTMLLYLFKDKKLLQLFTARQGLSYIYFNHLANAYEDICRHKIRVLRQAQYKHGIFSADTTLSSKTEPVKGDFVKMPTLK